MTRRRRYLGRRPAGKPRSARATVAAALAGLVLLAGLVALGLTAQRGLPGTNHYELTAEFSDAKNIGRYAEVRIAGRRVGQVIEISSRGQIPRLGLQLDPDVRPLRTDTTARIRLKGLLGAKFVDLNPGRRGRPLPDGGIIPSSRTSSTVELTDLVASFDERGRANLGTTLRGLGEGFLGRGEGLNEALAAMPSTLGDVFDLAQAVNARGGAAERFFPSIESAAAAFDPVREQLARGFAPQARALQPFVDRRRAVQGALEAAPPALDSVREGLAQSDPLLRETAGFARATARLTRPAPAALRGAAELLRGSRRPLTATRELLRRSGSAVPATLRLTRRIDPLIEPTIRSLRTSLPGLREWGRRRCDILALSRNWRSMFAWGIPSKNEIGPQTGWRLQAISTGEGEEAAGAPRKHPRRSRYTDLTRCVAPEASR